MRFRTTHLVVIPALALAFASHPAAAGDDSCPALYSKGIIGLDFNPAFVHVDRYDTGWGFKTDGLTIASFFNAYIAPGGMPPVGFFERDLVARIPNIGWLDFDAFDPDTDVDILTDLGPGAPRTVWPNEAVRAPDGVFPFEAVVVPQGFLSTPAPGRLTAVNLDDPDRREYVIHQSTQNYEDGFTFPGDPANSPRAYHKVVFADLSGDGLDDIITVRSGFRVVPAPYPPFGELVWFENPGANIDPDTPWRETVLWGGPAAGFAGPDIDLAAHDLDGDGQIEIIATHFFTGADPGGPPTGGTIAIYGAPVFGTWAQVDANAFRLPRVRVISDDQGFPFGIELVDLNMDGHLDILASNHQPDNCTPMTASAVPGRVYALEQPADGDLFVDDWTTHVLLDDIRPNPTPQPIKSGGRLAPGRAQAFWPVGATAGIFKPHIVVGGDEAGKVWVLTPKNRWYPNNWQYDAAVIFDINDFYGPMTTQTPMLDPFGITNSTIGGVAVRYRGHGYGAAEIYVPAFEARDIHVFTYAPRPWWDRVSCVADQVIDCPAEP